MPLHEIPTHLHGADPVVAGCTWSQLLTLGGGAAGAFWTWHTMLLPQVAQGAVCALPVLVAAACAFWRPDGHGLLTWLGLVASYAVSPHRLMWQREAANRVLLSLPPVGATGRPTPIRADQSGPVRVRAAASTPLPWPRLPAGLAAPSSSAPRSALPEGAARVGRPVLPARRGGLLAVLLGQRVLCLSTHHLRLADQGSRP